MNEVIVRKLFWPCSEDKHDFCWRTVDSFTGTHIFECSCGCHDCDCLAHQEHGACEHTVGVLG